MNNERSWQKKGRKKTRRTGWPKPDPPISIMDQHLRYQTRPNPS